MEALNEEVTRLREEIAALRVEKDGSGNPGAPEQVMWWPGARFEREALPHFRDPPFDQPSVFVPPFLAAVCGVQRTPPLENFQPSSARATANEATEPPNADETADEEEVIPGEEVEYRLEMSEEWVARFRSSRGVQRCRKYPKAIVFSRYRSWTASGYQQFLCPDLARRLTHGFDFFLIIPPLSPRRLLQCKEQLPLREEREVRRKRSFRSDG
ncbi:unnamed protein product [Phaeothamnion confervicola]